jgi:group I intron endonuclease
MHVYAITNLVNGKVYIGQHAGDDLQGYFRMNLRYAQSNATHKPYLYSAMRKHGVASFVCTSLVRPIDKAQMDALEVFFIRSTGSRNPAIGYNLTDGGDGVKSGPFSEAHKRNLSRAKKGTVPWNKGKSGTYSINKGRVSPMKGRTHSTETKAKMSLARRAYYGTVTL